MKKRIKNGIALLNQDMYPLSIISLERAIKLVLKNKVSCIDYEIKGENVYTVKTVSDTFRFKDVIVLKEYIKPPKKHSNGDKIKVFGNINPNRDDIFLRDDNTCLYCENKLIKVERTLDHIIPKSRKDKLKEFNVKVDSWENLATCCNTCNRNKDDKTDIEFVGRRIVVKKVGFWDLWGMIKNKKQ